MFRFGNVFTRFFLASRWYEIDLAGPALTMALSSANASMYDWKDL